MFFLCCCEKKKQRQLNILTKTFLIVVLSYIVSIRIITSITGNSVIIWVSKQIKLIFFITLSTINWVLADFTLVQASYKEIFIKIFFFFFLKKRFKL